MHHYTASPLAFLTLIALVGCSKEEPKESGVPPRAEPAVETAKPVLQKTAGAEKPASSDDKGVARSTQYPSLAEWDELKTEVTVKGSSSLKCETKILENYLRVHCIKNGLGAPTTLQMKSALPKNALASTSDDALTLVHPFKSGTKIEAVFSWDKESHVFVAEWPKGEARPVIVGVFEGAASPLDRLAPPTAELLNILAKFQVTPKECLSPVPMWGDLPSYEKVVAVGKKDYEPTSYCSPSASEGEKPTKAFDCCVSFNEGSTRDDDEGYGSATQICFKLDEKRMADETTLACHFAG